jgi:hypothetical protein
MQHKEFSFSSQAFSEEWRSLINVKRKRPRKTIVNFKKKFTYQNLPRVEETSVASSTEQRRRTIQLVLRQLSLPTTTTTTSACCIINLECSRLILVEVSLL